MNSKERVMTALNHEKPDRPPINFRATPVVRDRLADHFETDYAGLLDHFEVDFREVTPEYVGPDDLNGLSTAPGPDVWGVSRKESVTEMEVGEDDPVVVENHDVYVYDSAFDGSEDVEDVVGHDWPSVDMFDFSDVERQCDEFEDYAIGTPGIHAQGYHGVFHQLTYLFGMDKAMGLLITDEELVQKTIEQILNFWTDYYEELFQQANGKIDFLFYKDDFGAQDDLLISRDMILNYFIPAVKRLADLAHEYDADFVLHSDGAILEIIPDLIDAGVDVLDPIQTSAKGMDIDVIQERFGEDLVFHGGIDTQKDLPNFSVEEIKDLVNRTIGTLGKGGGYFFSPCHRIQPDAPLENVFAMYEVAKNYSY